MEVEAPLWAYNPTKPWLIAGLAEWNRRYVNLIFYWDHVKSSSRKTIVVKTITGHKVLEEDVEEFPSQEARALIALIGKEYYCE